MTMKLILSIVIISLLLLAPLPPDSVAAGEGTTEAELSATAEAAVTALSGAETAPDAAHADAPAASSSLWKKIGGWGAAGAIVGSVAPGPGNIIGFICGIAAGAVHHFLSEEHFYRGDS